jgi:hypothetical protein
MGYPTQLTLPDIVAANLNLAVRDIDVPSVGVTEPPWWAEHLIGLADRPMGEAGQEDRELDAYLSARSLAGVVLIHSELERER